MSEENVNNQETPEQPEVTPESQTEATAAPETPPVEVTPPAQEASEEQPAAEEIPAPAEAPAEPVIAPVAPMASPVPPAPPAPPIPTPPTQDTNAYITWGWVLVALAFLSCCCGPLFAIPGIILGIIAYTKGDQRGLWIIIVGALALLLGGGSGVLLRHSPNWIPNFRHGLPQIPGGRPV